MCVQTNNTKKSQAADAKLLKSKFARTEEVLRSMCISLAEIQHIFGDEEFETLMGHINELEKALQEKKKLVGS